MQHAGQGGGAPGGLGGVEHPLFMDYGPVPGWAILLLLFAVSGGFFGYQVIKSSRLVLKGKPEKCFENWPA